uniref:SRCR domain-containing protein n=1 Tax=Periophthalmus magnuspinnatus TaxID=409849 RepID=A0A3B4AZ11_9GOBI
MLSHICFSLLESVRLINGTDRCSGRLEVFHNGQWSKICNSNWGSTQAKIVCRELECGAPQQLHETLNFGDSGAQRGYTASCSGSFNHHHCLCEGVQPLRLANGTGRCSGRVEVFHDGQWGTVCDDMWDIHEAEVVCRAMDCGSAQMVTFSAFFGQGDGNIWLDDLNCLGNESSLVHCQHPSFGENNCGHGEDAGVICSENIRLTNGTDQCSGQVEIYHNEMWSAAVNVNWGMNEGTVICREMNCGDALSVSASGSRNELLGGVKVSCSGRESAVTECTLRQYTRTGSGHLGQASVVCSVKLEKPSITLTSPHAMLIYSPEKLSIKKGDYFFITCSVHSTYPGGYFYLTKSNTSRSEPKAAFGHSIFYMANFEFPSIQYEHQGLYSCVYAMNISSQSFFSDESKTIQVTVVGECLI